MTVVENRGDGGVVILDHRDILMRIKGNQNQGSSAVKIYDILRTNPSTGVFEPPEGLPVASGGGHILLVESTTSSVETALIRSTNSTDPVKGILRLEFQNEGVPGTESSWINFTSAKPAEISASGFDEPSSATVNDYLRGRIRGTSIHGLDLTGVPDPADVPGSAAFHRAENTSTDWPAARRYLGDMGLGVIGNLLVPSVLPPFPQMVPHSFAVGAGHRGNVCYETGNGDYGEWLVAGDVTEWYPDDDWMESDTLGKSGEAMGLPEGLIVYVREGHFFRKGPGTAMVVTNRAAVVGNANPMLNPEVYGYPEGKNPPAEVLSFIGQLPVLTIGPAKSGDYLVPIEGDNYCRAIPEDEITFAEYRKVVGTVWQTVEIPPEPLDLAYPLLCAIGIK
jgi:hypothetical protein